MGDDGSEKVPRPTPDEDDEDVEASAKLLENGVNADGMAAADRIEPENGKTETQRYKPIQRARKRFVNLAKLDQGRAGQKS